MRTSSGPPDRYTTAPLPPYRYRPGRDPHPTRDPRGHGYVIEEALGPAAVGALSERSWSTCKGYLLAIDLFNEGYYWECHEALEGFWREAEPGSDLRVRLQGLIQVAAALLKHALGRHSGASRLSAKGGALLSTGPVWQIGVDGPGLARRVDEFVRDGVGPRPTIRLGSPRSGTT